MLCICESKAQPLLPLSPSQRASPSRVAAGALIPQPACWSRASPWPISAQHRGDLLPSSFAEPPPTTTRELCSSPRSGRADSLPYRPMNGHIWHKLSPGMSQSSEQLRAAGLAKGCCAKHSLCCGGSREKQIQVQANEEQRQTRRDGGSYLHVVLLCRTKSHGAYAKAKFT